MLPMSFAAFGTALIAFIGYGCSLSFMALSLTALWSALFRNGRAQSMYSRDMNAFSIAGVIAFLAAVITTLVLKIIG